MYISLAHILNAFLIRLNTIKLIRKLFSYQTKRCIHILSLFQCDAFAAEKFINLTKAYDTLVDDARRSRYKTRNPYFGHKKEEYEWNIPVCTKGKPASIWESIKELYPDYVNGLLCILTDLLRMKLGNALSVFNTINMIELQRLFHEKLTTTMAAVYLRLISLKSTVYTLTDNFKRGRYDDFPEWLRRILIETKGM